LARAGGELAYNQEMAHHSSTMKDRIFFALMDALINVLKNCYIKDCSETGVIYWVEQRTGRMRRMFCRCWEMVGLQAGLDNVFYILGECEIWYGDCSLPGAVIVQANLDVVLQVLGDCGF